MTVHVAAIRIRRQTTRRFPAMQLDRNSKHVPIDRTAKLHFMKARYNAAWRFDEMVAAAQKNVDLWKSIRARAAVDDSFVNRVEALGGAWHLLVLSEDWCGDSVSTLPFIDELASRSSNLDLRILARDQNLDIMEAHLTNGTARSIPVVIAYDQNFVKHEWWGPRPTILQHWVQGEGQGLEKSDRYKEQRKWYAHDRGHSTLEEVVSMLERAAVGPAFSDATSHTGAA
jgi:hypothetical protein